MILNHANINYPGSRSNVWIYLVCKSMLLLFDMISFCMSWFSLVNCLLVSSIMTSAVWKLDPVDFQGSQTYYFHAVSFSSASFSSEFAFNVTLQSVVGIFHSLCIFGSTKLDVFAFKKNELGFLEMIVSSPLYVRNPFDQLTGESS